jgi:16S rRNA (guanine527-N7)-methyltransferase
MKIGSSGWKQTIVEGARKLDILVQPDQADQFARHAYALKTWNKKINLTAIESPLDMAVKHFLDSIVSSRYIKPRSRLLDVGSGAGFPGLPLKIMIPSLKVTLVDATRKKVSFLNHVIQQLSLTDISALHNRVENLTQTREGLFDVIVCRAFSSLSGFVEKSLPLLAPDGVLMAYKGKASAADMEQISRQNGNGVFPAPGKGDPLALQMNQVRFVLPFLNLSRTLVLLTRV